MDRHICSLGQTNGPRCDIGANGKTVPFCGHNQAIEESDLVGALESVRQIRVAYNPRTLYPRAVSHLLLVVTTRPHE